MAERERSLTAAFDDMLRDSRQKFEILSGRPAPDPEETTASPPPPEAAPGPVSPAERRLAERFGEDWRYEVLERRRDGGEVTVLCKVTAQEGAVVKSQFGSARLDDARAGRSIAGSADGVAFSLVLHDGAEGSVFATEEAAYARAVELALGKCADLM